jgi:uncharacterized membrane protein YraQ (UPF0718 family)
MLVVIGVLAMLTAVRLFTADGPGLPSAALSDAVTLAISVIIESLPFVFLGIILSIAVQLWVPTRVIMRLLPRSGWSRRAVLSFLGVVLPVCECGNVPLARGLMTRGLSVADSVTFLLAAPILNPITIVTTYQAFGWNDGILVSRIIGGFVIANLVGWMISRHPSPQNLLTPGFAETCRLEAQHGPATSRRLSTAANLFAHETSSMLPALFVGAAIAGFIQVALSREALTTLGGHPLWGVLALMALAFVIAICSNVDAFFALSLASTFSPGALIAFLVFGPMIDVKMIAMLRTTFTARTIATVTAVVALATLVLGLGVNLIV